jgi:hypothetical protein
MELKLFLHVVKCTSWIMRINKIYVKLIVFLVQNLKWYVPPMWLVMLLTYYVFLVVLVFFCSVVASVLVLCPLCIIFVAVYRFDFLEVFWICSFCSFIFILFYFFFVMWHVLYPSLYYSLVVPVSRINLVRKLPKIKLIKNVQPI